MDFDKLDMLYNKCIGITNFRYIDLYSEIIDCIKVLDKTKGDYQKKCLYLQSENKRMEVECLNAFNEKIKLQKENIDLKKKVKIAQRMFEEIANEKM